MHADWACKVYHRPGNLPICPCICRHERRV